MPAEERNSVGQMSRTDLCQLDGEWACRTGCDGNFFEVDLQLKAAYRGLIQGCESLEGGLVVGVEQPRLPSRSMTASPFVERVLLLAS